VSRALITWIGGPVLRARMTGPFTVYEALSVGPRRLLGEVIQLKGDELVAQVYEDTTGLEPGQGVEGTGRSLSVNLGPGLLGGIFDGLLRPLTGTDDFEIQPGIGARAPGRFEFTPEAAAGTQIQAGQTLGTVAGARRQSILVPPGHGGRIESIVPAGEYAEDEPIAVLAGVDGTQQQVAMRHGWPVRTPRPVANRLPASAPMITGQRILDTLFPVARGGRAALPGGFGTGKTVLQEALAKWCDADVIVYVGCGERGNEMAEVLDEFPKLEDPRTGRSRLAEFYERAARVTTLGGQEGSVAIIGAVSPPAGDFSEPVTLHTKRYVRCFWALDRQRAQARFYPAIHPLQSYSADADALAAWWKLSGNPDWITQRQRVLALLEQQSHLERMARIVGRDALPAQQQLKLLCADLVNEGFLRQSSFSKVDRYCSPQRQAAMIAVLLTFMDRAEAAVQSGVAPARLAEMPVVRVLQRLGEEFGEGDLRKLAQLPHQLDYEFDALHTVTANVR